MPQENDSICIEIIMRNSCKC